VNREICLSISGHHEETWQPAWGIRTALVAIRSFMDTEAKGQIGGVECDASERRKLAAKSAVFKCGICGKSNEEILSENGGEGGKDDVVVPEELRLAYKDELEKGKEKAAQSVPSSPRVPELATPNEPRAVREVAQRRRPQRQNSNDSLDKAIYALAVLLTCLVARKLICYIL
jgi:ubiquitin-conjugating enzyme E2 J1